MGADVAVIDDIHHMMQHFDPLEAISVIDLGAEPLADDCSLPRALLTGRRSRNLLTIDRPMSMMIRVYSFMKDAEETQKAIEVELAELSLGDYWISWNVDPAEGARYWQDPYRQRAIALPDGSSTSGKRIGVDFLLVHPGGAENTYTRALEHWLPKMLDGGVIWIDDFELASVGIEKFEEKKLLRGEAQDGGWLGNRLGGV